MRLAASHWPAARFSALARQAIGWLGAALIALSAANAEADTQRLTLQPSWNLVSFAVIPVDATPAAVLAPLGANFKALWAYDAVNKEWSRYPQAVPGLPTITTIEPGRGYWLEVTNAGTLDVVGASDTLAQGPNQIAPEWNLVGFPLVENTAYERVLNNAAIRQVWTFDAVLGSFQGVIIDEQGLVTREDFVDLEPGRGYWIRSVAQEAISLAAELRTNLPMDVDLPPILTNASVTERVPWPLTQGDVDVGRDGFYDRAATQRGLDFGDRIYEHRLVISNQGFGLLTYRAAVVDPDNCEWLRILETDPADGSTTRVAEVSGAVTIERARIVLMATRDNMGIGEHQCDFVVNSNGAGPDDANREFSVRMRVGDLEGDYRLRVQFDTVNGNSADLANPRITLGLYPDSDGLKAVIDAFRTLLIPSDVKLAGRQIETGTTRFEVSGSFETPAGDPGNPFGEPVRRDITIRGERADRTAADGVIVGSQDLLGEYFETIRGVTAEPIRLFGTFTGERLSSFATVRDGDKIEDTASGNIPDPPGILERTLTFTDRLLIDEVDIAMNLEHPRPADLVVSLIAPDGTTEVILRENSEAPLFNQIFDEFAVPQESLAVFNGMRADGDWTLRIEDQVAGETGSLLNWSLDIRGTAVFDLAGSAPSLPVGTTLVLTGCGRTEITTTEADLTFRFTDLIDCVYQIAVQEPGFGTDSQEIVLNGADLENLVFNPAPAVPLSIKPVQLVPGAGPGPWFSQGLITHDGVSAWQSGDIGNNEQTDISATVFGPGTLSFWWKVSSEENWDYLRFFMDGAQQAAAPEISGIQDWAKVTVVVPAGSHALTWRYFKDGSVSNNADAGWVDEVRISTEFAPREIVMPASAEGTFLSLTTRGGAGAILPSGGLQYGLDAASFDLDRLPLSPSIPGLNDSDAFDAFEDALTKSNTYVEGGNGVIDPPVGEQARRITINIGMPVVGSSVQEDLRLSVGANP